MFKDRIDPHWTAELGREIRARQWVDARQTLTFGAGDPGGLTKEEAAWLKRQRLALELMVQAERGDLSEIRFLLEQGADPNFEAHNGLVMSPLARAAICDEAASIAELIEGGADPDLELSYEISSSQFFQSTALIWASREGSANAVRALLAAGADVNARECVLYPELQRCMPRQSALDAAKTPEIKAMLRAAGARS